MRRSLQCGSAFGLFYRFESSTHNTPKRVEKIVHENFPARLYSFQFPDQKSALTIEKAQTEPFPLA
jgi:hypothetical protein